MTKPIPREDLQSWWEESRAKIERLVQLREKDVHCPNGPDCYECYLRRRRLRKEEKVIWAQRRWFHQAVAPGADVCEDDCPHLAAGMSVERGTALLESMIRYRDGAYEAAYRPTGDEALVEEARETASFVYDLARMLGIEPDTVR